MGTPTTMLPAQAVISVGIVDMEQFKIFPFREGEQFKIFPFMVVRRYAADGSSDRILVNWTFGENGGAVSEIAQIKMKLFEAIPTQGGAGFHMIEGESAEEVTDEILRILESVEAESRVLLVFPKREWNETPFYNAIGFDGSAHSIGNPTTLAAEGLKVLPPFEELPR